MKAGAFAFLGFWLFVAYLIWPAAITDPSRTALTMGAWFRAAASLVIVLAAGYVAATFWKGK